MKKKSIKIMIVDDHKMHSESVKMVLEEQPDFKIIEIATNGKDALEKLKSISPDVILMDISMNEMDGIDASEIILKKDKNKKVIIVSSYSNRSYVSKALQIGVSGFVLKNDGIDELITSIRKVMNNESYYSPIIAKIISDLYQKREYLAKDELLSLLSNAEIEILRLWALGKTVRESSDSLFISMSTVEKQRHRIKQKIGVGSNSDATLIAIKHGLISIDEISS